ncbi:TIGR02679 family protein [Virgibacillus byunsanensis]|uniref:TIGR02679 family protein n=1 Tax=Virgibacillus byunsanensis TaxID=570945 RepID=A0ABW3LFA2_9BACI
MDKQLQQAIHFFKSEQTYKKLFQLFRKKYESLGRIGGTVSVDEFSDVELDEIGSFFGVPGGRLKKKGSISVVGFEQQLQHTRFNSVGLKQLLDAYFGEIIVSKKQQRVEKEEKLRVMLVGLKERYEKVAFWLDYLLEKRGEARWMLAIAEKEPQRFEQLVGNLAKAVASLPESVERLPMFSQRITADPHAFDLHTDLGKMLLHVLALDSSDTANGDAVIVPGSTEAVNELLQRYRIYRDDLLNYVTCAGFYAETADGPHPVWEAATRNNTVQIVPLRELVLLKRVYPSNGKDVWVVENSGVCATLLDYHPSASIICTNGQFTLAVLMMLDLAVEEGCVLHYAGDFDPEGLGMAQRLLDRYPEGSVQLWQMDKNAYRKSSPVKELPTERIEKLSGIVHDELVEVAKEMRQVGKAGYQEALVEDMVEDIQKKT